MVSKENVDWHRIYDPSIFIDDDGTLYLIFGHCCHYIVKLNDDMISFAEEPHLVEKIHSDHICGGEDCITQLEDKPFFHKANGIYYLSIGASYMMAKTLTAHSNVWAPLSKRKTSLKRTNLIKGIMTSLLIGTVHFLSTRASGISHVLNSARLRNFSFGIFQS